MHSTKPSGHLERKLKNRHIQLIALGGTIGTGLFLGSAGILQLAGPSMLLGYAVGGLVAFLIMRLLGEMLVEDPVANSFSHFAHRYLGPFAGFLSGWNCVVMYVLVGMLELTAVGKFVQFWWPQIPVWATAAAAFVLINGVNFINVRAYAEFEFWFALIKIAAVLSMILMGATLVLGADQPMSHVAYLWSHGGFFPNGVSGLVLALPFLLFSFGGIEMLGFTAAEAQAPERSIPRAINQVIARVLLFYVGATAILLMLSPWDALLARLVSQGDVYSNSPFVLVFSAAGQHNAAAVLNFVVITAALSVYNSMVYSSSRLLYGMALEGDAPASLASTNARGVPVRAITYPALITALCIVVNFVVPAGVIELLLSLTVAALLITWGTIILTHLRYRRHERYRSGARGFPAPLAPWSNYFCLAFLVLVLGIMAFTPSIRVSALAIPVWIGILAAGYWLRQEGKARIPQAGTAGE